MKSIIQNNDGGFVFLGDSPLYYATAFFKTDKHGNIIHKVKYPSDDHGTYGQSIIHDAEGGFYVAYWGDGDGPANSSNILKVNSLGEIINKTSFGSIYNGFATPTSIQLTSDGGAVAALSRQDYYGPSHLLKVNHENELEWLQEYWDTTNYENYGHNCNAIVQTKDKGYFMVGSFVLNGVDKGYMLKVDSSGEFEWSKHLEKPGYETIFYALAQNEAGEFYMGGTCSEIGSSNKPFVLLMKTDAQGDTLWTKTFYGLGSARPRSMVLDHEENPVLTGSTIDTLRDERYVYLIRPNSSPYLILLCHFEKTTIRF